MSKYTFRSGASEFAVSVDFYYFFFPCPLTPLPSTPSHKLSLFSAQMWCNLERFWVKRELFWVSGLKFTLVPFTENVTAVFPSWVTLSESEFWNFAALERIPIFWGWKRSWYSRYWLKSHTGAYSAAPVRAFCSCCLLLRDVSIDDTGAGAVCRKNANVSLKCTQANPPLPLP